MLSHEKTLHPNKMKMQKNSVHGRHDSGELDVFEAARYFSGTNDHIPSGRHLQRRSLDMPMMRSNPIQIPHHIMIMDHRQAIENKKFKQPRSPGGRLASFLNSLFNQSHSKKKKKPKSSGRDFVEDESGRRKRRSSISHFLSSTDKKSPPYANTPTKSCKINGTDHDLRNGKNYKITLLDELHAERNGRDYAWIEEKLNGGNSDKLREEDEGGDSDSSSDLFDLPNHDLDFLSSGLPVYGTTHMDRITDF